MNLACILQVNGELKAMPKREPTLAELQAIVGGYVQVVIINFLGETGQMIMDEDGKNKDYPLNGKATAIAQSLGGIDPSDWVVGDVVILMGTTRIT
jgi:hypothetical protein